MKKGLLVVLALLLVVSVAAISCAQPAPAPAPAPKPAPAPAPAPKETYELRFSSGYPPVPYHSAVTWQEFMDQVTKRSGGRVTWDTYWGGALASVPEHFDLVAKGVIDLGVSQYGAHPAENPLFELERCFIGGPTDTKIVSAAWLKLYDTFPEISNQGLDHNQKLIMAMPIGSYHAISYEPLKTLDDFAGKIMGAWGSYMPLYFEPIGSSAISTPGPERYLTLKQKLIDASVYTTLDTASFKLYEVAKYYTLIGLPAPMPFSVSMNLDTWDSLDKELQDLMMTVGREMHDFHNSSLEALTLDAAQEMKDAGVTFYELPEADKLDWYSRVENIPWDWAEAREAEGYPGHHILQVWVDACADAGWDWLQEWQFVE